MDKKTFIAETLKEVTLTQLSRKHFPLTDKERDAFSADTKFIARMLDEAWNEISDTDAK